MDSYEIFMKLFGACLHTEGAQHRKLWTASGCILEWGGFSDLTVYVLTYPRWARCGFFDWRWAAPRGFSTPSVRASVRACVRHEKLLYLGRKIRAGGNQFRDVYP